MSYDVAAVRRCFPALAEGLAHFDGPGGTQVPEQVTDAIAGTLRAAVSNRGGPFVSSERAEGIVTAGRQAVADLVGGQPAGVVFGASMTAVTYVLAGALAKTWAPGDNVVVTRLDHDANVRPWVQAAERAGAELRWLGIDREVCDLRPLDGVLDQRTRLVAVTGASNAVGTRPDVPAVAEAAHAVGALVAVDGVHLTPHAPVDVTDLGADLYALSAYKFYGPHLGALVADPELLEELHPDKLLASPDTVPGRFEYGTPPFALLAGLDAAVDYLAGLVPPGDGRRRPRVLRAMAEVEAHETELFARLHVGLREIPGVTTYGAAARRAPTAAFRVDGHTPREVSEALGRQGIATWDGHYYAIELVRELGLLESGGMVRAGISHYTTAEEVDQLLAAITQLSLGAPATPA